jgi:fucose 4-O-acetylase-like acetyltransferase
VSIVAEPRPAVRRARGRRDRHAFLDNARLALIALVVVAHVIRLFLFEVDGPRTLYVWSIVFLMPAFAAVAGHVSRPTLSRSGVTRLAMRILVPYLVFELIYTVLLAATRPGRPDLVPWTPTWLLWFLPALFLWRLTLPLLVRTGAPLAVAVTAGLAAGFLPAPVYTLGFTRFLVLYPFFVLGFLAPGGWVRRPPKPRVRLAALVVLGVAGVFAAALGTDAESWLHGTRPYASMGVSPLAGPTLRLGHYLGATAAAASFLALVPRRRGRLSDAGGRTLYVYLLHGIVLLAAASLVPPSWSDSALEAVLLLGTGVALALVLSTRPIARATRALVEPQRVLGSSRRVVDRAPRAAALDFPETAVPVRPGA